MLIVLGQIRLRLTRETGQARKMVIANQFVNLLTLDLLFALHTTPSSSGKSKWSSHELMNHSSNVCTVSSST
jgi:hypothetical protein